MTLVAVVFLVQVMIAGAAFALGRWVGGLESRWVGGVVMSAALALMLVCGVLRVFPATVIDLAGAAAAACTEFTIPALPGALFFGVASRRVERKADRRAIGLLLVIAGAYFVKAGWWMVGPGVRGLGPTKIDADGVCRQSTNATCVPASMVTALRARGIDAGEEEMARLAYTDSGGTTDSRALWALERKLAGTGLTARYVEFDAAGLAAAPKPVLVQLNWGFFVSHMVPVLEVTDGRVVLGDPAEGVREMTLGEFEREWKGMGIVMEEEGGAGKK